jgi:hypothetical protein
MLLYSARPLGELTRSCAVMVSVVMTLDALGDVGKKVHSTDRTLEDAPDNWIDDMEIVFALRAIRLDRKPNMLECSVAYSVDSGFCRWHSVAERGATNRTAEKGMKNNENTQRNEHKQKAQPTRQKKKHSKQAHAKAGCSGSRRTEHATVNGQKFVKLSLNFTGQELVPPHTPHWSSLLGEAQQRPEALSEPAQQLPVESNTLGVALQRPQPFNCGSVQQVPSRAIVPLQHTPAVSSCGNESTRGSAINPSINQSNKQTDTKHNEQQTITNT